MDKFEVYRREQKSASEKKMLMFRCFSGFFPFFSFLVERKKVKLIWTKTNFIMP
jgi:hypothetical protein